MKVRLKASAFTPQTGVIGPGLVEWPEGVPLPKGAVEVPAETKEEKTENEPELPLALSEVDILTGKKKK